MRAKTTVLAALAVLTLGAVGFALNAAATATTHEIVQQRRDFGIAAISIARGDSIAFVNADPYAHNVYSEDPKGWLDLGIQEEGDRNLVQFDAPGTYQMRCRIHPRMRLTVTVN